MLSDYFTQSMIQLNINAVDWRASVQAAGDLLLNAGVCESRYIQAMIDAVEKMGPYMVLAPGIALVHARPEDGVKKVGIGILTLNKPVNFGSPENDPVKLVIPFGAVDHVGHIQMLQELAVFLSDETNQNMLKTAQDVNKVMAIFGNDSRRTR